MLPNYTVFQTKGHVNAPTLRRFGTVVRLALTGPPRGNSSCCEIYEHVTYQDIKQNSSLSRPPATAVVGTFRKHLAPVKAQREEHNVSCILLIKDLQRISNALTNGGRC
jgi:hypothetical protein